MELHYYDEDVSQNPFYSCLTQNHNTLFDKAATSRWTICVPRVGSLADIDLTVADFESHILHLKDDDSMLYVTINNKEVSIHKNVITTGNGFELQRKIPILFEETFFNKNEESYRVLCINQPLEGGEESTDIQRSSGYNIINKSVEECANILWGTSGNARTRKNLGHLIDAFQKSLGMMSNPNLKQLHATTNGFFNKAMITVKRDPYMKRTSQLDHTFLDNVKLAIENHLMYGVHKKLFRLLCTCTAVKDSQVNKITRNLSHIQLQHLKVRVEFCQNVPRARKELSNLTLQRTPTGKLNCIKRLVAALTRYRGTNPSDDEVQIPLTTDDLLPILVFLVLKADVTNWWAHFQHMTSFRISKSNYDDEYGFYLATLEAALEHVGGGDLLDLEPNQCLDTVQIKSPNALENEATLWQKQDEDIVAIDTLFQYVKDKNKAAVTEILQRSRSRQTRLHKLGPSPLPTHSLCHPLCTCDKCKGVMLSANQKRDSSHVTAHSRDAKGYTVLHVAAFYGHVEICDTVIKEGALVNGVDYLNQTPLHIACRLGYQAVALLLLHNGAMFNGKDSNGNTPLHLATLHGHDDCAKALIFFDQGGGYLDMDPANDFGDTPLHMASKWGFASLVKLLLENGASATIKNRKNHDALRYSHNDRIAEIVTAAITKANQEKLMHRGMLQMSRSQSFYTTLPPPDVASLRSSAGKQPAMTRSQSHASIQQPPAMSRRHSEASLSATSSSSLGSSWEKSFSSGSSGVKKLQRDSLIGKKSGSQKIDKLLKAIADGDIHMAKFHLGWMSDSDDDNEEEADLDLSKRQLCHPLCQCDKCLPIQKVSTASANKDIHVNSADHHGYTSLHVAAHNGHVSLVDVLLRRGANVNIRTSAGTAPLHMACKQPNIEVLHKLLKRRADVNAQDNEGNTPLHYCCMMGNERKARLLIENSADVSLTNKKGNTPLHDAVRWNFLQVVRLLLKSGAAAQCRNKDNKLPKHYAQTEEMSKVLSHATWISRSSISEPTPDPQSQSLREDKQNLPEDCLASTQTCDSIMVNVRTEAETLQKQTPEINSQLPSISEVDSVNCEPNNSEILVDELEQRAKSRTDSMSGLVDLDELLCEDCNDSCEGQKESIPCSSSRCRKRPGKRCADGYFDINLEEEDFDPNMIIVENHYGDKGSNHSSECDHGDDSQCDCCSENSNTESQQDLSD